jgi:hypothetical protein
MLSMHSGANQLQLKSPLGCNVEYVVDFASKTSGCGATAYSWTKPITNATIPISMITGLHTSPALLPCASTVQLRADNTANSIAIAKNVFTFSVVYRDQIPSLECDSPLIDSTSPCLQSLCARHRLRLQDTYLPLVQHYSNTTYAHLLA